MKTPAGDVPPAPDASGPITLRVLVRDRPFLLYLIGQTTSGAGSALSSVALMFAVLAVSGSPESVGLVLLTSRLPPIGLTLIGGLIADRWSRKLIVVCTDATRTALQLGTGVLLLSGHATVIELAGLQFLSGGASALFGPAAGALLAGVAPRGQIRRASSLLGITTAVAQTGGLAVSGVIVALAGPGTSFLIDGVTFGVSSLTLGLIPAIPLARPASSGVLQDLREGLRVLSGHGWLVLYKVHVTLLNVLVLSPFFVLGPVIAKTHLGGAPAWSAIALGYVIGNLAAAHITFHWAPPRPILAALTISTSLAPMLALLGLSAPISLIVPAAFVAGAETTIYNTLTSTALQANLPGHTLGRATAISSMGSTVLVPIGMGLSGIAASAIGTSTVLLSSAALTFCLAAICTLSPASHAVLKLDRQI